MFSNHLLKHIKLWIVFITIPSAYLKNNMADDVMFMSTCVPCVLCMSTSVMWRNDSGGRAVESRVRVPAFPTNLTE